MKHSLLFHLALFSFCIQLNAQVSWYVYTETSTTYSTISGTTIHASGWDDPTPSSITIPFTFTFDNIGYTSCSVNGNGYITFGSTVSTSNDYTPISSTTAYAGAISGLGINLVSNSSTISYTTTGSSPNRIFIVQWSNCRRSVNNASGADWNFQIKLFETTNVVQIQYGACAATNTTNTVGVQVGLRGASNADFNNRERGSPASWASGTGSGWASSNTVISRNTAVPPSGLTFTWTPPFITTSCNSTSGNVIIYSNYDGGRLNINVDQNISNLKIGVCSYEAVRVNITGTFASNVTQVVYAGFNGTSNTTCSPTVSAVSIIGVSSSITTITTLPAATVSDINGDASIVCGVDCQMSNSGGCNTPGQLAHYFLTQMGGSLRYQSIQYGCWSGTQNVSSGGNCCIVSQVLPVQLSYFYAACINNGSALELNWETQSEINNNYFTIERSIDGVYFYPIAQIQGQGNSSQPHLYRYVDNDMLSEQSYYRLRQTDFNGQSELFPTRAFDRKSCVETNGGLYCFPNPAFNSIVVQFNSEQEGGAIIVWADLSGRIYQKDPIQINKGLNNFEFNLSDLPAGTYILSLQGNIPMKGRYTRLVKQ